MQCNTDLIKYIWYTTTFANSAYQKPQGTSHITTPLHPYKMWNILCTVQMAIQGLFLLYPPNSFFAQNISFRMFPSLEFSYVVYMVIHVNLITAKSGIILKINKWKNIHLKLWHLYEKKKTKSETHSLSCKHWLYIIMGRFNEIFLVSWIFHVIFQLVSSQLHEENITIIMPKLQCARK